ncbi:excisionase family DNA-binding protein [Ruminococcus flavefaciens]|uniref:DNA binding domain-containing protein, excisionase family n=1 Tax=Ruminococcus flavefaciens TaxID=1265 RepID=A0A1K1MF66_RUMFL|nr:excisionase family DNA-binding protein [Ruminococcus flavefaciens]SFW21739.1 DNA binding domain-containing protein, excisionase family [Ruminococcus flavefaciens]
MKKMNSINATFKLCKEQKIGISMRLLRQLVKEGTIPSIKTGRSYLINWDGLMKYLDTHTQSAEKAESGIRKISA